MKRILLLLGTLLFVCSCTSEMDQMFNGARDGVQRNKTKFYASTESSVTSSPATKVYADENMKVLWNADDRISIFNKSTYNYQYAFTGEDGDTAGDFEDVTPSGSHTGTKVDYITAVYPYSKNNEMDNEGGLTMELPAEQAYKAHSFGIGANSMIAVTEGDFLAFKNIGGYLSLRLYGDQVAVSKITIQGNNGEKIAGKAGISMPLNGVPTATMDASATDAISVVCNPAVILGAAAEEYTEFWFVIPPVTFENGFTITVTDDKGGTFEKSTTKSFTVSRNQLDWMNPIKVVPNYVKSYVDLGLPSGLKWAVCNVGASSPEEYGDYFAWGETEPKSEFTWLNYKFRVYGDKWDNVLFSKYNTKSEYDGTLDNTIDYKTRLELTDDAACANWGGDWRMPSYAEWVELKDECTWTWTTQNEKNGYLVTGPNGNSIFLPAAGLMSGTDIKSVGSNGYYWSSSLSEERPYYAWTMRISPESYIGGWYRYYGLPIRPVFGELVSVSSVSLDRTKITLYEGEKTQLAATVLPEKAFDKNVIWSSSNPSVASVYNGWVTARQLGSAIITATTVYGEKTAQCAVTVTDTGMNGHGWVDLGLSVKWASCNMGTSCPEDYGSYFAWGETDPKDSYEWSTYKWCNGSYNTLLKYNGYSDYGVVDNKIELELSDDAARAKWGKNWRMPTGDEMTELITRCDWRWMTQGGANGYLVTGPNGNSIFLPAAGYRDGGDLMREGTVGWYWSSSLGPDLKYNGWSITFDAEHASMSNTNRFGGLSIRPVYEESPSMPVPEAVDLGLSVKWASFNLGASYDTDYGDHFAWGETKAKGSFTWTGYKFRVSGDSYSSVILYKYNTKQSYGTVDNRTCLELWDDAARVNLGGKWRIPTYEEIEELRTQCYWTWTSKGYRVTSKKNQNSIFLPAAGYYLDGSSGGGWGTLGYYWSSSLNTEDPRQAWRIDFRGRESGYSPGYSSSSDWRYMGFSIRPVTE